MAEDLFRFRRFLFELDGVAQGAFERVDPPGERVGITMDADRKLRPEGPVVRTHARLFAGVANTRELFGWFSKVLAGTPERRRVELVERDEEGRAVARHVFVGAWPVRLRLATLTPEQLFEVEELELAVERWTREPAVPDEPT